jgi:toxin YoeB
MNKVWFDKAWDDYEEWQNLDKNIVKRINKLIKDIERNGNDGIGKPICRMAYKVTGTELPT